MPVLPVADARYGSSLQWAELPIGGKKLSSATAAAAPAFVNKSWTRRPNSTYDSTLNSCTAHWTEYEIGAAAACSCSPMQLNTIILHELIANPGLNGATYCFLYFYDLSANK